MDRQAVARSQRGLRAWCAWRQEWLRPAVPTARGILWRCAPGGTRHPPGGLGAGSWQRLAARVPRQAIYTATALSFDYEFVIYSASSDALRVGLLVFLELWLVTYLYRT